MDRFGQAIDLDPLADLIDRLPHHSETLTIRGDSYRLREKRQAGLLNTSPADHARTTKNT